MVQQRVCCVETNLLLLQICYCLLVTNIGGTNVIPNVMRQTKGSATKALTSCPNFINLYNNSMGDADTMDYNTVASRLDRESKYRYTSECFLTSQTAHL